LAPPSTPKLEGASVSRAGSRVSPALLAVAVAVGEAGGIIAVAGNGAVPVPARCEAVAVGAAVGVGGIPASPEGLVAAPRTGGGGGPDLPFETGAGPVAAGLSAGAALPGWDAGRGGDLGDSVTDDSARDDQYATACACARFEHYKEISEAG
jgi:hypothetical protein